MPPRLVGRYRLPHVKGQPSQARAADRALDRLIQDANERAVLRVVVDHADGAAVCFLTVARLTELAGIGCERTVQRVMARLRKSELLEVYESHRDPARYGQHLPQRARQGSGPNWYRLGASIRGAAGYREVDLAETYGEAAARPQIASMSPPNEPLVTPDPQGDDEWSGVTPDTERLSPPDEQELSSSNGPVRVTPRTENGKPCIYEERLEEDRSEETRAIEETPWHALAARLRAPAVACADDGSLVWRDEPLGGELGLLADAEALVEAGVASWA